VIVRSLSLVCITILIEQHHRPIRCRTNVIQAFTHFRNAKNILAGIELMHRIRKDPLELARVVFKEIAV